jgi:predicted KAP-like P-loop ATPase
MKESYVLKIKKNVCDSEFFRILMELKYMTKLAQMKFDLNSEDEYFTIETDSDSATKIIKHVAAIKKISQDDITITIEGSD